MKRAASQAKRAATREASVAAGLDELTHWLHDLLRQGLATAQSRGPGAWDAMAARMIDAQAPGIASLLRDMATVPASGEGWQTRLLAQIARLHLLIQGYQQREHLPPALLADLRTRIGWTQDQESVRAGPRVRDQWLVMGQTVDQEEQLRVQRSWLWALEAQRPALLLAFAAPGQPFEHGVAVGTVLDAELAYFESAIPLRALLGERHTTRAANITHPPGYVTLADALSTYTDALAHNPWLERFPLPLRDVTPMHVDNHWLLRDNTSVALPLDARGWQGWRLAAMSGGQPIGMFGTWDGTAYTPLSAWSDGQLVSVEQ